MTVLHAGPVGHTRAAILGVAARLVRVTPADAVAARYKSTRQPEKKAETYLAHMRWLARRGFLAHVGGGAYRITAAGRTALAAAQRDAFAARAAPRGGPAFPRAAR